jgi:prevent-host-death family protein
MTETGRDPARVGVRELRQNLSVYLARVKAGEVFDVTEHGSAVARLEPIRPSVPVGLARLEADGSITPARFDHRTLEPPPSIPGRPLSDILQEMRDEDDR